MFSLVSSKILAMRNISLYSVIFTFSWKVEKQWFGWFKTCSCPFVCYFGKISQYFGMKIVFTFLTEKSNLFWTNKKFVYLIFINKSRTKISHKRTWTSFFSGISILNWNYVMRSPHLYLLQSRTSEELDGTLLHCILVEYYIHILISPWYYNLPWT